MKKILSFVFGLVIVATVSAQSANPTQLGNVSQNISIPNVKHNLESRATGTYYLDYLEYDRNFLGSTINNGVYGNLAYTRTDTAYGGIPFVAEYYDSLIFSTDLQAWNSISWQNVASLTVDSVFILLNLDNSSGMNDYLKMSIVYPTQTSSANGAWLNFNTTPVWQDSATSNIDIGTISAGSYGFDVVALAPGVTVNQAFGLKFEFFGPITDTCRLLWSYPTDGSGCANNAISDNPLEWELYPTSFYNICLGGQGGGPNQMPSIGLPRIAGTGGFGYYADCQDPATPYLGDTGPNFDPAKNQFQHWNIWAIVTLTDNLGISEQAEKGIKVFAYPNPATDFLNIDFTLLKEAENINLTLTDLSGRVALHKTLGAFTAGKNTTNVAIDLASGVYTYSLDVDGTTITRKFIVNK